MPLIHLLYRCPRCGQDPLPGRGDRARCPSCGTGFARGRGGGTIEVREGSGEPVQVPSHLLAAAVRRWEAGDGRQGKDGAREVVVRMRQAFRDEPVRYRGRLLGFVESLGDPVRGVLKLRVDSLDFRPSHSDGQGREASGESRWLLGEIRAVQTTSSALQIAPREGGVVEFRFQEDSPQRWEFLLHRALRSHYMQAGRGVIVEFQPRIRTR